MTGVQYLISDHTVTPDCAVHGCTPGLLATQRGVDYMIYFTCRYRTSTIKAISFDGHRCGELRLSYCVFISLCLGLWAGLLGVN